MEFEVTLIVMTGMVLSYLLLKHIFTQRAPQNAKRQKERYGPSRLSENETRDLRQQADELLRRLSTIEEILAADVGSKGAKS